VHFHAAVDCWKSVGTDEFMLKHSTTTTLAQGELLWIPPGFHPCMMSPQKSCVVVATLHDHELCKMADDTVMLAVSHDILEFVERHAAQQFIFEIKNPIEHFVKGFKIATHHNSQQDAAPAISEPTAGPPPWAAAGPAPPTAEAASESAVSASTEPCPALPEAAGPAPPPAAAASKAAALAPKETDVVIDPAASQECRHHVTIETSDDTNAEVPPTIAETATPNLPQVPNDADVQ
jgi:hypothetical protein